MGRATYQRVGEGGVAHQSTWLVCIGPKMQGTAVSKYGGLYLMFYYTPEVRRGDYCGLGVFLFCQDMKTIAL